MATKKVQIDKVVVGERFRETVGDLSGLCESIQRHGLLHPIVIASDNRLIVGQRRLEACRKLGMTAIEAKVVQLDSPVNAEADENVCRMDFTPEERLKIGEALEEEETRKARERQKEGGKTAGRGRPKGSGNLPEPKGSDSRDAIAKKVGWSGKTYEAAKKVKAEAKKSGNKALIALMNKKGPHAAAKEAKKQEKKAEDDSRAKKVLTQTKKDIKSVCDLRNCGMKQLLKDTSGIDAIITDPPYPEEFLPLYGEMAALAKGIPLVAVMCGQSYFPRIVAEMTEHLEYRWTMCYWTPGASLKQWPRKMNTRWKPILLFGAAAEWVSDDVFKSEQPDKDHHEWGQSESGMLDVVSRLTKPGQLICDPFLGAGTTAVAALRLQRRFIGCDIDKSCIDKTWQRIALDVERRENRVA